jgi:hypothetical protein
MPSYAAKDPRDWDGWLGNNPTIVTFNNDFVLRSGALSLQFYQQAISGFPAELYGIQNDGVQNWKGLATYHRQRQILRDARLAFVTGPTRLHIR